MKNKLSYLASLKITVVGLLLLALQTLWGTFYQIENGLYQAQQHIFNPWIAWVGGYIPVPGTKLVLWVLTINLVAATFFRLKWSWSKLGILIIHAGLILLMVSGGVTYYFAQESHLTLEEGEGRNTISDYHQWELAIWKKNQSTDTVLRKVEALDFTLLDTLKKQELTLKSHPLKLKVLQKYSHSAAYTSTTALPWNKPRNGSNLYGIESRHPNKDPAQDLPGLLLEVVGNDLNNPGKRGIQVLLYGADKAEADVPVGAETYQFSLRHKRTHLPFFIRLDDFHTEDHPGTSVARKYESWVTLVTGPLSRKIKIHMNHPLREGGYTFFQASFSQSNQGQTSTLAVVKNPGRLLPYLSSLLVGLGLCIHFLIKFKKAFTRPLQNGKTA